MKPALAYAIRDIVGDRIRFPGHAPMHGAWYTSINRGSVVPGIKMALFFFFKGSEA